MALRDTWHRTLVYFGLAEEEDPRYETVREPERRLEVSVERHYALAEAAEAHRHLEGRRTRGKLLLAIADA